MLFVKICDEKGNYGWGEATLEGHTRAVESALDEIVESIIGLEAEYAEPMSPIFLRGAESTTAILNISGSWYGAWDSIVVGRFSCQHWRALISHCGT